MREPLGLKPQLKAGETAALAPVKLAREWVLKTARVLLPPSRKKLGSKATSLLELSTFPLGKSDHKCKA